VPTIEKFPKSYKFTLGDHIETIAIGVLKALIDVTYTRERTQHLRQANLGTEKLRGLMHLQQITTERVGGGAGAGRHRSQFRGAAVSGRAAMCYRYSEVAKHRDAARPLAAAARRAFPAVDCGQRMSLVSTRAGMPSGAPPTRRIMIEIRKGDLPSSRRALADPLIDQRVISMRFLVGRSAA
jgi:hypothetical protein